MRPLRPCIATTATVHDAVTAAHQCATAYNPINRPNCSERVKPHSTAPHCEPCHSPISVRTESACTSALYLLRLPAEHRAAGRCGTKMRARTAMRRRASACRWSVSAAVCARSCALCSRAAALDIRIPLGCELYYNLLAAQARPLVVPPSPPPATDACAMLLCGVGLLAADCGVGQRARAMGRAVGRQSSPIEHGTHACVALPSLRRTTVAHSAVQL